MTIKALIENRKGDEEEIEVELPFYYKQGGPDIDGAYNHQVKVEVDKISSIFWRKQFGEVETYVVEIDKTPKDWMNPFHSFYFANKRRQSNARSFELAHKRAMKWIMQQNKLLKTIQL